MSNEKPTENKIDSKYEKNVENFYKTVENTIEDYHKTISHFQIVFLNSHKLFQDGFFNDKKIFDKNLYGFFRNSDPLQISNNLIFEMTNALEFQSNNFKKSIEGAENSMKIWNNGQMNLQRNSSVKQRNS